MCGVTLCIPQGIAPTCEPTSLSRPPLRDLLVGDLISFHGHNDDGDVDRLVEALGRRCYLELFGLSG